MDKKPSTLASNSGLPHIPSEEAAHEQWMRGPRVLGPSIATLLVQQSKATPAKPAKYPSGRDVDS